MIAKDVETSTLGHFTAMAHTVRMILPSCQLFQVITETKEEIIITEQGVLLGAIILIPYNQVAGAFEGFRRYMF